MNTKKLVAGCTAAFVLAGNVMGFPIQAQASATQQIGYKNPDAGKAQMPVGGMRAEFYQVDVLETANASIKRADDAYSLAASQWAGSGCDFYFSTLNTMEKKLYLELKKQADSYMTGTENFETTEVVRDGQNVVIYILPLVSYEGMEISQMKKVFYCFMFENPQYYFMRNSVVYSDNTKMMAVGLYEAFADGQVRSEYTSRLAGQLADWEGQIAEAQTIVDKEAKIHQLVCGHVSYNNEMAVDDPDDREMSQSCISAVLFGQSTVCAGYAQLFTLLCARAGITCVTVTSDSHAWNKVRMGDFWYNVDCTWDDNRGDDAYLNVADERLLADDTEKAEHILSPEWDGVAPACTGEFDAQAVLDTDGGGPKANVLAPEYIPEFTAVAGQKGKLSVNIQPAPGCDGYIIQYAPNALMDAASKKGTEKANSTITGLKSGKVYYIRVRAYTLDRNGDKLFGAYSDKIKAAVK